MRSPDERGQGQAASAMPDAVLAEVPLTEGRGNAGPWKAWKTKSGFPTLSTVPWKSRRKREIPTFPPPGFASMEKWKTKSRFPTFPRPLATITTVLSLKTKNQRKEVGRCAASSFPVRFSCSSFDWKMLEDGTFLVENRTRFEDKCHPDCSRRRRPDPLRRVAEDALGRAAEPWKSRAHLLESATRRSLVVQSQFSLRFSRWFEFPSRVFPWACRAVSLRSPSPGILGVRVWSKPGATTNPVKTVEIEWRRRCYRPNPMPIRNSA